MDFPPTRAHALARLAEFAPAAGIAYARTRNYDRPGHANVSGMSPYLRHRIVTEEEVLADVLLRHGPKAAETFIAEVFWRTYWKGWLEQRPSVWTSYRAGLRGALNRVQTEAGLRAEWETACTGDTGIDAFDHWAHELVDTGYLHNHARMWFASIWIFTLRLPWELGADFFLRHLLDGDPASNTLSWRWVAGLQTVGKTYLATADNIAEFTDGRFRPNGLASHATPVDGLPNPDRSSLPVSDPLPQGKVALLLTEDDLSPDWLLNQVDPAAVAVLDGSSHRSPLKVAGRIGDFVDGAVRDLETRIFPVTRLAGVPQLAEWAKDFDGVVMPYVPVGGSSDAIAGSQVALSRQIRPYDTSAWPHATAGFFKFKKAIPDILDGLDLTS